MDAVNLVISALSIGAVANTRLSAITTDSSKFAYKQLKSQLQRRHDVDPALLASWEANQKEVEPQLREALATTGVEKDEEVIETAQKLYTSLQPMQTMLNHFGVSESKNERGQVKLEYTPIITIFD